MLGVPLHAAVRGREEPFAAGLHTYWHGPAVVFVAGHKLREDEQQADQKRLLLERFQEEVCRGVVVAWVVACVLICSALADG